MNNLNYFTCGIAQEGTDVDMLRQTMQVMTQRLKAANQLRRSVADQFKGRCPSRRNVS